MELKMKRLVQWLQIPDMAPLPVMDRVFEECTSAFLDDGCRVKRVTTWEELEDGGLLFFDDAAGHYLEHKVHHERIARMCPNSVMIAWYWTDPMYHPFPRMIVTGEWYMNLDRTAPDTRAYMLRPDFVPLGLRANEPPEKIGTYSREVTMDYCFMGGGYKMDWIPPHPEFTGLYHRVIYTNYLSYEERRHVYLSSRFALAFQSDPNIQTGHMSQRIFEGLAYGCIVFCENSLASKVTDGAVIHVTSKEDLWAKMREWKTYSDDRIQAQQQKGYDWIKKYGTNRTSMERIWNRIQSRFHVDWDRSSSVIGVSIMGGLGNQCFQLAAAYACAEENGAQLQIQKQETNGNRSFYWGSCLSSFIRWMNPSVTSLSLPIWNDGLATVYRAIPLLNSSTHGLFLNGYFQSSKYFKTYGIKEKLRKLFRAPSDLEHSIYHAYPYLIRNAHRVVVLHARRTDYLIHHAFHGPLDGAYYRRALDRIVQHVSEPIFLLTGDDPAFWSEIKDDIPEVFQHPHIVLQQETDVRTFILLQQFNYFIMSNSTFMWWVVWLSHSKKAIVPAKWFGPAGLQQWEDLYEPEWERV
jgi:hypothetical protein